MKVEELRNKSENQLLELAQRCFDDMDAAGIEQRPALLLQAQMFMNQADRQTDSRIATRDFWMEIAVIVLIGVEIFLSIVGIVVSGHESNQQADILGKLNASATATAIASTAQAQALPRLVDEQTKSLASLAEMNSKLQDSVQRTTSMSVAMQMQLKILQDEQAARLAELAKKPKLELYVGGTLLTAAAGVRLASREFTTTKATYEILLRNSGDATATKGLLRIIVFGKDVSLECSSPFQRAYEPETDTGQHAILINFDYLRPGINIPMSVTATYPAGQMPFSLYFNVDADGIAAGTPVGSITITPPKE